MRSSHTLLQSRGSGIRAARSDAVLSPSGHDQRDLSLNFHPNIRGSLFMVAAMAAFTINDAITKAVASEMNIGQIMLVRGVFAIVLIAALAAWRGALRPLAHLADQAGGHCA